MIISAVVVNTDIPERTLSLGETKLRDLENNEVLVEVKAAGLNRADLLQREGKYPPPAGAPETLGLELSGIVKEIGPGVSKWKVGDEVFGLVSGGAYATMAIASEFLLWRKPQDWNFSYAAAIPEGIYTAFLNLVIEGELSVGERVLIQGGGSGVGTFAVQIARRLGAQVIATAGSDDRCRRVVELGAHECINYKTTSLETLKPFDLILDLVGGPIISTLVKSLNVEGRIVVIAVQGGAVGQVNLVDLMQRRGRIIGSVLRSRTLEEKVAIKKQIDLLFGEAIANKEISPVIDSLFPLADVEKAHERMRLGEHFGKIVLTIP